MYPRTANQAATTAEAQSVFDAGRDRLVPAPAVPGRPPTPKAAEIGDA